MTERLIDAGPWGPVQVRVASAGFYRIWLDVSSMHVELDESSAGELLAALAEALRSLAAPHTGDTEQGP